ncbi:MAG: AI-2E family transporter [Alphaproteobacteria bacterium]
MTGARHGTFWLMGLVLMMAGLYLLRPVLLPFVAGMAVAYVLDPVADRLEAWGLSRTWATTLITLAFGVLALAALALVVPLLADQIGRLLTRLPEYFHAVELWAKPFFGQWAAKLNPSQQASLKDAVAGFAGDAVKWLWSLLGGILNEGAAVLNVLSLIVITPVVTFYLLRDWDQMVAVLDGWLPRRHSSTIHQIFRDIDRTIAGFVRGQASVCLALGTFYGLGLTLVGLDVGLIVGFISGMISFIPYLGTIVGFVTGMGLAVAHFSHWHDVALVALVFAIGQLLEGNVLTPRLVGRRVHLHPVWILFALLAGGTLFGFLGILLAVPAAAVIGVLVRFGLGRYLEGPLYRDEEEPGGTA